MKRKPQIKGHKLITWWSGVQSGYANGKCECGKEHTAWTSSMRSVQRWHRRHVEFLKYGDVKI